MLHRLEKETFKQQITQDIQVQAALNGMDHAAIRSAISTHAPKTLDDVKQLTLRMGSFKQEELKVAQATIPSKLETTVDVPTAAVAQLAARLDDSIRKKSGPQQDTSPRGCPRWEGRRFSTNSCRAMGTTCYKCKKNLTILATSVKVADKTIHNMVHTPNVIEATPIGIRACLQK